MYPMLLESHKWEGEDFLLSSRDESESAVKNGDFRGLGINEALRHISGQPFDGLPIYIKKINTMSRLPVTVYPEGGKTTLVYITDCTDGAEMVYGLSREVSREELLRRAVSGSLSAVCNFVCVQKGDVFFIPAGVVFAVGSGVSAIEISTNKDLEYIVSDYGERQKKLDINRAVEVMSNKKIDLSYGTVGDITLYPFGTVRDICSCEAFCAEEINMDGNVGFYEEEKTASVILVSGEIDLSYSTGTMHLRAGDSLLLPPGIKARLSGRATIIYTVF